MSSVVGGLPFMLNQERRRPRVNTLAAGSDAAPGPAAGLVRMRKAGVYPSS